MLRFFSNFGEFLQTLFVSRGGRKASSSSLLTEEQTRVPRGECVCVCGGGGG